MHSFSKRRRPPGGVLLTVVLVFVSATLFLASLAAYDDTKPEMTGQEKVILDQLRGLRKFDDPTRAHTSKNLASLIRQLPDVPNKLQLAGTLAKLDVAPQILQMPRLTLKIRQSVSIDRACDIW